MPSSMHSIKKKANIATSAVSSQRFPKIIVKLLKVKEKSCKIVNQGG
jgi:hypothetical protein